VNDFPFPLKIAQIEKFLPHRAPFLLIDKVLEISHPPIGRPMKPSSVIGTRVLAQKNVTFNEPHMAGHFPGYPIMPGVLITEAMAQAASFSIFPYVCHDLNEFHRWSRFILAGTDRVKYRQPVEPGDVLLFDAVVTKCRGRIWAFDVVGTVNGKKVAEAKLLANLETTMRIFE